MTRHESMTRVVGESGVDAGPGERLREAREAAGLTLGEVASRLRLEPRAVERLENDDYEALHGPTFVRGYLGSYARLLNLPAQPILEAYERHGFGPPALVSELGGKSEVHVSDFPVRMVTYVIAGLLVVLVVLWWQSRQIDEPTPQRAGAEAPADALATAATETTSSPESAPMPATSAPLQPVGQSADQSVSEAAADAAPPQHRSEERAPVHTAQASTQVTTQAAPAAPPADSSSPQASEPAAAGDSLPDSREVAASEQDAPAAPASSQTPSASAAETRDGADGALAALDTGGERGVDSAAPTPGTAVGTPGAAGTVDTSASNEEPEATPPRPQPLPGSDVLAIQLSRESWIEIYDRGGGRLYYSLAEEGSEVVVTGAGPMRVLLGEVDGAEVAYNGEPYDLSRFRGRSVVRFTVGESSDPSTPQASPPRTSQEPLTGENQPMTPDDSQAVADARENLDSAPLAPALRSSAENVPSVPESTLDGTGEGSAGSDSEPAARATRPDS